MKMLVVAIAAAAVTLQAFGDHHASGELTLPKYTQSLQGTTDDLGGYLSDMKAFADSGLLQARGAGMAVYQINAGGNDGAQVLTDFYYPNADALPSPNVMTQSDAHMQTFTKNTRGIVSKGSTIYETIYSGGALSVETRVFVATRVKALSPDYAMKLKSFLKDIAVDGVPYGVNEVVSGGIDGETHMIWFGYKSLAHALKDREKNWASNMKKIAETFTRDDREVLGRDTVTSLFVLNSGG